MACGRGDHLDRFALARLPESLPILTTPQAQRRLRRTRLTAVQALPTWESHEWDRGDQRLRVTAVPGKHGPGFADRLLPDVMGSVIELETGGRCRLRLYITGDTLYGPHLSEIPRRFGEIDVMIIHLGGTKVLGLLVTMDGRQGVETTHLIRPDLTVPIHYDDYKVQKSPLSDYLDRARDQGLTSIEPINRGATAALPIRAART
jgi:L-ascorbate metabolism protein UlaG (beta-lactamase superfamily)